MMFTIYRHRATIASALLFLLLAGGAPAAITQQLYLEFDPTPADAFNNDEDRGGDSITGNTPADIDRAILGSINGPTYSATGSIGVFGNYGVQSFLTGVEGELFTQVFIEADVEAPSFGVPRPAQASFIIDGGSFDFTAGPLSTMEFVLTLSADSRSVFQSVIEVQGSPGGGAPTITTRGVDLGLTQVSPTAFEIPFSFQTVDLGILNPGQVIDFEYQLDVVTTINDFAEGAFFEFEDPLSVQPPTASLDDPFRPTITFIPEPSTTLLAALAVACLAGRGRPR